MKHNIFTTSTTCPRKRPHTSKPLAQSHKIWHVCQIYPRDKSRTTPLPPPNSKKGKVMQPIYNYNSVKKMIPVLQKLLFKHIHIYTYTNREREMFSQELHVTAISHKQTPPWHFRHTVIVIHLHGHTPRGFRDAQTSKKVFKTEMQTCMIVH